MKGDVLIMGAGPAGLAAAFELRKAGREFTVLEKEESVGGIGKTLEYGEFKTDVGPHRFFSQNKYLYDMIGDLLGEHWVKVERLTRFYIGGKFFLYPIQLKNALLNVGPYKAFRIVLDYSAERLKKIFVKPAEMPRSFEEQVVSDFGKTLADLNMLNYTEKIWGIPCNQISTDWAKQRIKGLSIRAVLKNAITKSGGPKTLVDQFYYPDDGSGMIYEAMKKRSLSFGEFKASTQPAVILHDGGAIIKVVDDKGVSYSPKEVLSSIPITALLKLMKPKPPKEVFAAAEKLKFRSHVSLFVTLNRESVFPDQWIYFPDGWIPFGRIMEPKNFSRKLSPRGKTSLFIEFFCWKGDSVWNAKSDELLELALPWLEKTNFIKRRDIIEHFAHRLEYAYPVYDINYKENLTVVKGYLDEIKNLQLVGRAGAFKYNNQDHALEMGILAARNIIEGRRYNLDEVGSEQEYFERGYVK
jgi:protoporphyrinogen oxidase